ncbi:SPOSA6832_03049 [Sporobolomyces salmonicolor]|uniref:SPOSA6832_03049-mRNA-1:cds n=1 Tax=Sporidiobolus salmonicolor TaxID=5005 RepID=A0A0D6EP34_SPOSA|nr:SPOSA6832_03049 [Sporobolomyces salmonicolor]
MPKKSRQTAADPTAATPVPSRDALQRLSYLYQASVLLNTVVPSVDDASHRRKRKKIDTGKRNSVGAGQRERERVAEGAIGGTGKEQEACEMHVEQPAEGGSREGTSAGAPAHQPLRHPRKLDKALEPVSKHLVRTMNEVAKKATVRMDPTVKRTLCKGCSLVLVPGVTSSRRFPTPPHALPLSDSTPPPASVLRSKRERREARQARPPVFFEREGHVTIAGDEVLKADEYTAS